MDRVAVSGGGRTEYTRSNVRHGRTKQDLMKKEDFAAEEYKRISSWSKEYDKNIIQIFGGMVVSYTSLMSALSAILLKDAANPSLEASYAFLAPILIIVPAFRLMLSQRIEIVRMAAFVYVFYEKPIGVMGWEGALKRIRERKNEQNEHRSESNDPLPWTIWVCMFLCVFVFVHSIYMAYSKVLFWSWLPGILFWLLSAMETYKIHKRWNGVISKDLQRYKEEFQIAKETQT